MSEYRTIHAQGAAVGELQVRVTEKRAEAVDVCSFEMTSLDGGLLPPFSAGAHIDVHVGPFTRQYSLCNKPAERSRYEIAVLRQAAGRGGSVWLHEQLGVGDTVRISRPRNNFRLAEGAARHLLFAGGIGVTPILCMAEHLASEGGDFQLHYCARSMGRAAFRDRLAHASYASRVEFHFDDGPEVQKLDFRRALARPGTEAHVYACGPKGFIEAVFEAARARGWTEDHLHHEMFASDQVKSPGDSSFEVMLARSCRTVQVGAGQSVVEALTGVGIRIPTSCEQGICGTCLTPVLAGVPDHRDSILTASEKQANDRFLPCCSRSRSAVLILDL